MRSNKIFNWMTSVLFFILFAVLFMPVINISIVKISMIDIYKMINGSKEFLNLFGSYTSDLREMAAPYIFVLLMIFIIPLAAGVAVLLLDNKRAAYVSVVAALMNLILLAGVAIKLLIAIEQVKDQFDGWGSSLMQIQMNYQMFFFWIILNIGIIFINVKRDTKGEKETQTKIQPVLDIPQIRSQTYRNRPGSEQPVYNRTTYEKRIQGGGLQARKTEYIDPEYHGAIAGIRGRYQGKVYMLDRLKEIAVEKTEMGLVVTDTIDGGEVLCTLYFINQYQEYCMTVNYRKKIYLESGQPLGENRTYYLPRGTKVYIEDDGNLFQLA